MPSKKKAKNPFYTLLVLAGSAFGLTAFAYFIMAAMATYDPARSMRSMEADRGLFPFMDRYGKTLMIVELSVLGVATFLAIVTDGFWTRRANPEEVAGTNGTDQNEGEENESKSQSDD